MILNDNNELDERNWTDKMGLQTFLVSYYIGFIFIVNIQQQQCQRIK